MISFFDRLDDFMKTKGLNDNKISKEAGISNGLIGKARKRGSLSQENISKILNTYKELDANWLLTGEGQMFKNMCDTYSIKNEQSQHHAKTEREIMYQNYDIAIAAMQKTIEAQDETISTLKELLKKNKPVKHIQE